MKKVTILIIYILSHYLIIAQETATSKQADEEGVDLLKAPSSPAAQLLNFAPNSIERPTDLSSFWLSINNATSNLSRIPTSYAIDFLPASFFRNKSITLLDLASTKTGEIFWQTFNISLGYKTEEDSITNAAFSKTAVGIKFSLIRPKWSKETENKFNHIAALQSRITRQVVDFDEEIENDSTYTALVRKRRKIGQQHGEESPEYLVADEALQSLRNSLLSNFRMQKIINDNADYTELKKSAREFTIEREGPFLDFAGGFAARFPRNDIAYSFAENAGAWLTGGYEGGNNSLSIYGIARYLYQPERIYADPSSSLSGKNISTLDMGTRVLYASKDDKFNLSFESIYRSVLNKGTIDPSWRLVFSAEYDLGFNQKLTFNFGRDFDGIISKDSNLLAAVNFIAGFGNKRGLPTKPLQ